MTQLIIDGVSLPESKNGTYKAYRDPQYVDVEMVSGRLVREIRGNVWYVEYQYGYFTDEMKSKVVAACEKGVRQPIKCGFLTPTSTGELTYSDFLVTSFTYPKFMWSRKNISDDGEQITFTPMWGDFSIQLREVKPSD